MKHYLVIQLARFGDLMQTKRLLATLCGLPDVTVHLCLDRSLEPLARLVYPEVALHPVTAHGAGPSGFEAARAMLVDNRNVFAELQAVGFDAVYNLNFSSLNFRMAALFDPAIVHGYGWKDGQELIGTWPAMAMRWSARRRIGLNLVDFWGGYRRDMIAPHAVNPAASPKGGGIGVVLAGRESRRSLPGELLARTATTLAQRAGTGAIHLLGGKGEAAAGQAVLKQMRPAIQAKTDNLAGTTDWAGLIDVVGSLDLLLTPDTGTMHLAAHLGTPVLACFLSSAWCFETGPYGAGHTVCQAVPRCAPCLESKPCDFDTACLAPFADPGFQRHLVTGKAEHLPAGLTAFASRFDELGLTYEATSGQDPDRDERMIFRRFIRNYLTGCVEEVSINDHFLAQQLYRDPDWMAAPDTHCKECR
ncbi:MAG: glycosyltransferase family 9 protein [Pseudodesulfovibrio sp.]